MGVRAGGHGRRKVRRGNVAVAILDQVEEFDQQIAPARPGAQQLFYLGKRARIDLAAFRCLPRPASRRLGLVDNVHAGAPATTSPNRSRLLPTSVTILSGRTLAIARFGWGEVGPRQRAGRGGQRFSTYGVAVMRCAAGTPPRAAFGSPTLPLHGRAAHM